MKLWFLPSEDWYYTSAGSPALWGAVSTYDRIFFGVLGGQLGYARTDDYFGIAANGSLPTLITILPNDNLSLTTVAEYLILLAGTPLIWKKRKHVPERSWAVAYILIMVGCLFVFSSLLKIGESNRFRFDLGPLPLIGSVVILTAVFRALLAWDRAAADRAAS